MSSGMYQEQILDHYRHPRNKGVMPDATVSGRETNPLCGDEVAFYLKLDGGRSVSNARFDGRGCAISQASASILSTELAGKTVAEIEVIDRDKLLEMLGIPVAGARLKCALLPLQALRIAIDRAKALPSPG